MKYVLDSSVALKWVLPEADTAKAIALRDDYATGMHQLLAPDVFHVETLHSLTKAERQKRIAVGDGWPLWKAILAYSPDFHPHHPLLARAYQIASAARVGIYDCVYIALAEREKCALVTADDKLVKNLQPSFKFIVALASLP
jgi:predicted nucleic acid-binding protein